MERVSVDVADSVVKLGQALLKEPATLQRFEEDPVGLLREYGISVPEGVTNESLRDVKLLEGIGKHVRWQRMNVVPYAVSAVEATVEIATTSEVVVQVAVEALISPQPLATAVISAGVVSRAKEE
jgi:hypothetical protein